MKSCAQDHLFQVTSLLPGANTGEQAVQHLLQLHKLVGAGRLLDQRTQASEPFPRLQDNVEKGAEASLSWQERVLFGENEAKRCVGFEVHRKGSCEDLSLAQKTGRGDGTHSHVSRC